MVRHSLVDSEGTAPFGSRHESLVSSRLCNLEQTAPLVRSRAFAGLRG